MVSCKGHRPRNCWAKRPRQPSRPEIRNSARNANRHRPGLSPGGLSPEPLSHPGDRPRPSGSRPTRPTVIAKLTVERRDDAPLDAPLVLDGDGLMLKRLEIDGVAARRRRFSATPDSLVIATPPLARRFRLTHRDRARAVQQPGADGPLPLERRLLHAMRGGRLPPHHLFPRPARHPFGLHACASRPIASEAPLLLSNGNPVGAGELAGRPALRRLARPVPQAVLSVRAGRRRSRRAEGRVRHHVRPQGRARHLCRARQGARAPPMRWMR